MFGNTVGKPSSGTFVTLWPVEFSFVWFRAFEFGCDLIEISLIDLCCDVFVRDPPY